MMQVHNPEISADSGADHQRDSASKNLAWKAGQVEDERKNLNAFCCWEAAMVCVAPETSGFKKIVRFSASGDIPHLYPSGVLCRARTWNSRILVGPFQHSTFYDAVKNVVTPCGSQY